MNDKQRTTSIKYDKAFFEFVKIVNRILRDPNWVAVIEPAKTWQVETSQGVYNVTKHAFGLEMNSLGGLRVNLTVSKANVGANAGLFTVSFFAKKPPYASYLPCKELGLSLVHEARDERGYLLVTPDDVFIKDVKLFGELFPEKEDTLMNAEELEVKYLDLNGGYHPIVTVDDWKEAIICDITREGYWTWVQEELRHRAPKRSPQTPEGQNSQVEDRSPKAKHAYIYDLNSRTGRMQDS